MDFKMEEICNEVVKFVRITTYMRGIEGKRPPAMDVS